MPSCPYCQQHSATRRAHVEHLAASHTELHARCIDRSNTRPTVDTFTGIAAAAPRFTYVPAATGPNLSTMLPSPRGAAASYAALFDSLSARVPAARPLATATLESVRFNCNRRAAIRFANGALFELVQLVYCQNGSCLYPGPLECGPVTDDRIIDWGGRGRRNNCACRGHPKWGRDELDTPVIADAAQPAHDAAGNPTLGQRVSRSSSESSFYNACDRDYMDNVNDGWQ